MENKKKASVAWPWPWPERSFGWACHWSLTACLLQLTRAAIGDSLASMPDLKLLTPAQAANVMALDDATLWLGVAGAVAAVLAMLLDGRARRTTQWALALACVALASAVAIHCVITWFLGVMLVTAPSEEGLLVASVMVAAGVVFFAALDVNAALILIRRRRPGGEEAQEKQSMEPRTSNRYVVSDLS